MKLKYYTDELNFGDALNKLIFEHYIPELLDENEDEHLLGLGTVIGLEKGTDATKKIFVFSSGYGFGDSKTYGTLPGNLDKYEFICVRGPLTAEKLNLDKSFAITDGAVLLHGMEFPKQDKIYPWTYIPHHISDKQYNWKRVVEKAGGHYLSAANEPEFVIAEIQKSDCVIAEAMHGAIVSDVFRVPWIAAKAYEHINRFKWLDWLSTMELDYNPHTLSSLFNFNKIEELLAIKLFKGKRSLLTKALAVFYTFYQRVIIERKVVGRLKKTAAYQTNLSSDQILNERYNQLRQKIADLKNKLKV